MNRIFILLILLIFSRLALSDSFELIDTTNYDELNFREVKIGEVLDEDYVIKTDKGSSILLYYTGEDVKYENVINGIKINAPIVMIKENMIYPIICRRQKIEGEVKRCTVRVLAKNGNVYVSEKKREYTFKKEMNYLEHKLEEYVGIDMEVVEVDEEINNGCGCKLIILKVKKDGLGFKYGLKQRDYIESINENKVYMCEKNGKEKLEQILDNSYDVFMESGRLEIKILRNENGKKYLLITVKKKDD